MDVVLLPYLVEFILCCRITLHFVLSDGKRKTASAKLGDNLLDVVLENELDIDGYG